MNKARGIRLAGNWKMNLLPYEITNFFSRLESELVMGKLTQQVQVSIAPHYLGLTIARDCAQAFQNTFPIEILAQNAHWEKSGAYTGEISTEFLKAVQIHGAVIGHSERRQYFGESNISASKRAFALLKNQMRVIFCIGETRAEREGGRMSEVLASQLAPLLADENKEIAIASIQNGNLELAYEPVWAIGTGLTASPAQAEEAHIFVRKQVEDRFGKAAADRVKILYGGSVTPENFKDLLSQPNVDGGLVGGASLKPDSFYRLIQIAIQVAAGSDLR